MIGYAQVHFDLQPIPGYSDNKWGLDFLALEKFQKLKLPFL
jgi:hypothetical protein